MIQRKTLIPGISLVSLVFSRGAWHEPEDRAGISHLSEHVLGTLLQMATDRYPVNAFTTERWLVLSGECLEEEKKELMEIMEGVLELKGENMERLVEEEKSRIVSELERISLDPVADFILNTIPRFLYKGRASLPVGGVPEKVAKLGMQDIEAWIRGSDHFTLLFSKEDTGRMEFERLHVRTRPLRDREVQGKATLLYMVFPSDTQDFFSLKALADYLSLPNGPLYRRLRKLGVYSYSFSILWIQKPWALSFYLTAPVSFDVLDLVEGEVTAEIEELSRGRVKGLKMLRRRALVRIKGLCRGFSLEYPVANLVYEAMLGMGPGDYLEELSRIESEALVSSARSLGDPVRITSQPESNTV